MTNAIAVAVAALGNTPEGALQGQGPDPASAQDTVAANLAQHAVQARGAYASNTERALRSDVAAFTGWCAAASLVALPALPDTLVRYVDALAGVVAAIGGWQREQGGVGGPPTISPGCPVSFKAKSSCRHHIHKPTCAPELRRPCCATSRSSAKGCARTRMGAARRR